METALRLWGTWLTCLGLCLMVGAPAPWASEQGFIEGRLLVADPSMPDPRFARTVIYMVQHDDGGAFGLVVNRPLGRIATGTLLETMGADAEDASGEITVHRGGPVQPEQAFILHSDDGATDSSRHLANGLALTQDLDLLAAIGAGQGPARSLFLLGYAGWGPGQLDREMARGGWVSVPYDGELIFTAPADDMWQSALGAYSIEL